MSYTIDLVYEQIEAIVVQELKTAVEMCLLNMSEASSFEEDDTDYDLLGHLLHVLQYFTTHDEFQKYLEETKSRFESFDYELFFKM